MKDYLAFIMAGGGGTRFWPASRQECPKQFLPITGDSPLITQAAERLTAGCGADNVFIITNKKQQAGTIQRVPNLPAENIIAEPFGRNTAPCVGLAAVIAQQKSGADPVVGVFPADHHIAPIEEFTRTAEQAVTLAEAGDCIVTIGIKPDHPSTAFGYIKHGEKLEAAISSFQVECFTEKPDLDTAKDFCATGQYSWNAGMFFFRASYVLSELKRQQPDIYNLLEKFRPHVGTESMESALAETYEKMPSISFDYAVMEGAQKVKVVNATFNWDDVGSWTAVSRHRQKDSAENCTTGDVYLIDSENNTVEASSRTVALVGVDDLIVVETPDAVLVCSRDKAEDVKKVVEALKKENRGELL